MVRRLKDDVLTQLPKKRRQKVRDGHGASLEYTPSHPDALEAYTRLQHVSHHHPSLYITPTLPLLPPTLTPAPLNQVELEIGSAGNKVLVREMKQMKDTLASLDSSDFEYRSTMTKMHVH